MIHGLDTGFLVAAEVREHAAHADARATLVQVLEPFRINGRCMGLVTLSDRVGACSTFDRGASRVRLQRLSFLLVLSSPRPAR
jgi:hypothetical protein